MRITQLDPGFSTADAEYPQLHAAGGILHLDFQNWQGRSVRVEFREVCAFRWQEAAELLPDERYDGVSEVIDSDWVDAHVKSGAVSKETPCRHLRFNFNECGQLDVICESFEPMSGCL